MILPIYIYGNPVLRKQAQDITPDYPELPALIENMFETLTESDGVGLAAPQIGLDIRVVVIDLDVLSEDFPEYKDFRHVYINPHIVEYDNDGPKESRKDVSLYLEYTRTLLVRHAFMLYIRIRISINMMNGSTVISHV